MAIGQGRTVWILGAGFSKSLGAPLLMDLFRQQSYDDLLHIIGPSRAAKVAWSQALYNCGVEKKLWEDAEDFLAYIEAACGEPANAAKRVLLNGMIDRHQFHRDALTAYGEPPSAYKECSLNPLSTVLHAFGTEASAFLFANAVSQEPWQPYIRWAKALVPGQDSIITFNYDRVLEKLDDHLGTDRRLQVVLPGQDVPTDRVPVFKLHGSVTWVRNEDDQVAVHYRAVEQELPLLIAAPGRSKASLTSTLLKPLWEEARRRLKYAAEIAVVGYSFPKTDAQARLELLDAMEEDDAGSTIRRVHLVLGPDVDLPKHRRVAELIRPRMGTTRVGFIDEVKGGYTKVGIVQRHPLYAEDFIGDYKRRAR